MRLDQIIPPPPPLLQKKQQRQSQAKGDFCHCLFINLVIDQKSKEGIASAKAHKNKCMQQMSAMARL